MDERITPLAIWNKRLSSSLQRASALDAPRRDSRLALVPGEGIEPPSPRYDRGALSLNYPGLETR